MMIPRPPASLFREVILDIVKPGSNVYYGLPTNDRVIEKSMKGSSEYAYRITPENYERYLTPGKEVMIPISCSSIHHKTIQSLGHDRLMTIVFHDMRVMATGQTQLTFITKRSSSMTERWTFIACRAEALNEYPLRLYVEPSKEEKERDRNRFRLLRWRSSLNRTSKHLLESQMKKGNLHKDHASFLETKVKRLIASTYEEYIERRQGLENICAMGRRHAQLIREREST